MGDKGVAVIKKRPRELVLDALVGAGWVVYASYSLGPRLTRGGLIDLAQLAFYVLLAVLFVIRDPVRTSGGTWESLVAFAGTALPPLVLKPGGSGLPWLGAPLQLIGLAGMLVSAISLGRSFGIAPADRGLRTTGFYRWVRHPLYAAALCVIMGYLVANPTLRNLIGVTVWIIIQIVRIGQEERILEGYAGYAHQVRYRLVPWLW